MSLDIWPPLAPDEYKAAVEATQSRELAWLLDELRDTLSDLKHGLEDCYALLAPMDPGSTLVVSTPRNETVKGHITRVGTRIVKGTISLRLRTFPPQTLTLDPDHPIHLASLATLHTLLTHSIDLLTLTLSYAAPPPSSPPHPHHGTAAFIAAQLRLLSASLSEASAVLKGPPLVEADPAWTHRSAAPRSFDPPLPAHVSFHLGLQDSQLVLWVRHLEAAAAPVNLGMKFALAIGTARRLEHDEADRVFRFVCEEPGPGPALGGEDARPGEPVEVVVREKVRVESADPSLLSLSAKLIALGHTLGQARRNLAAVMGEEEPED